jgi:hypothetical protein
MGKARSKIADLFRSVRHARYRALAAKVEHREERQDDRQAEELDMAKEGVNRFPHPPMGGGIGI